MDLNGAVITTGGGKSRIQIDLAGGGPGGKAGLGGGAAYVTSPAGDFQILSGEKFFLELKSSDGAWGFRVTSGQVR